MSDYDTHPLDDEPEEEPLYEVCSRCDGTGTEDPRRFRGTCSRCGGTGIEPESGS